jgi:hypothetical protein
MDAGTGRNRDAQHLGMQLRGVEPADIHAHIAAEIIVAAEILALLGAGHGIGLDPEAALEQLGVARKSLVIAGCGGAGETADEGEVAIDLVLGDEAIEVLARRLDSARMLCARAVPNLSVNCARLGRRFPLVIPPLRDEAPSPGRWRSKTCTERPARASVIAALSPV